MRIRLIALSLSLGVTQSSRLRPTPGTTLPSFRRGRRETLYAINNSGQSVGVSYIAPFHSEAVLWSPSGRRPGFRT